METNLSDFDETIEALLARIGVSRREVEALIRAGEWQVWSAEVIPAGGHQDGWLWEFRSDFALSMPDWLDVDVIDNESIASAIPRSRLPIDSRRCHANSEEAIANHASGYTQAFRIRLRDDSVFWVNERVEIERRPDGTAFMLGVCTPATEDDIVNALINMEMASGRGDNDIDPIDLMSEQVLRDYVRKLKSDTELLARTGRWLAWAAVVRLVRSDPPIFNWSFRSDFTRLIPSWFDVDRVLDEDLAVTLGGARVEEDDRLCADNARRALLSGVSGYNQMFRVRLRDNRVQWIDEHVVIEPISPGKWHLVGVCVEATEGKIVEGRLIELNEQVQSLKSELDARKEELEELRVAIKIEKDATAQANAQIKELATTDDLTGVKNYRAFRDQLQVDLASAERYYNPVSLILVDIDHLKSVNDEFGHAAGDAVIIEIGKILTDTARQCDCVARCGGDEFAVIIPLTDARGAKALAERYRQAIETANWPNRPISASFGVSTTTIDCLDANDLMRRADDAVHAAKNAGRNRVIAAPPVNQPT